MSLKKKAAQIRAKGKKNIGEDSILAHISPKEAMLLKMRGGSGRRDPHTGLPHFAEDGGGYGDSGGWGGGLEGAPDVGTIGGGLNVDDAAPGGWGSVDSGNLSDSSNDFGFGFGFGDSNLGGFTDVGGFASPADATGWADAMASASVDPDTSFMDTLGKKAKGLAIGQVASSLGIPGIAMGLGRTATANTPSGRANAFGSTMANIGLGTLGPVGALAGMLGLGGAAGSALAGFETSRTDADRTAAREAGATSGGRGSGSDFDLEGVLTGLAGLYQGGRAQQVNQTAVNNNTTAGQFAQQQAQTLADMYGPNSPYAAQLRQQLERKDAAGGRRSQYGPREVELQARLAEMQSRNAPNILNANKQFMDANQTGVTYGNAGNKTNAQQLAGLFSLANKTGLTGMAQKGLGSLWDSFGSGGGSTGTGGFTLGGQTYNNPSAYEAPSYGVDVGGGSSLMPGESGGIPDGGGNFWDNWF